MDCHGFSVLTVICLAIIAKHLARNLKCGGAVSCLGERKKKGVSSGWWRQCVNSKEIC